MAFGGRLSKGAIVFDVGSVYLKYGFAGESSPRHIMKWKMYEKVEQLLTMQQWEEFIEPFITLCFEKYLQLIPRDRRIVLCEDFYTPKALRDALANFFLLKLQVQSIHIVPGMTMIPYATGLETVLVVDSGWKETRVLPIFRGNYLRTNYSTQPVASKQVCDLIQTFTDEPFDAQDLLVRCCVILPQDQVKSLEYRLPHTGKMIELEASQRVIADQVLFSELGSVASCLLDAVLHSPIDIRAALLQNIVLTGGTTMIQGFRTRLVSAIQELVDFDKQYRSLKALVSRKNGIDFPTTHFLPNVMTWIGASVYGSFDMKGQCISKADFDGHAPDWMVLEE